LRRTIWAERKRGREGERERGREEDTETSSICLLLLSLSPLLPLFFAPARRWLGRT
jgi:hypothetical protein